MNKQLKFSWGHIIAFLALIFIGYVSFMGTTYLTQGNFAVGGVVTAVVIVLLFALFMGMQMTKATTRRFAKRIWTERLLVFASPLLFAVLMLPYAHFWTVNSHSEEIVGSFKRSIKASKQMFDDYETYANTRLDNYSKTLETIAAQSKTNPALFKKCGFTKGHEITQKGYMTKTLRLELLSSNYDSLRTNATQWIEASSQGASTWNIFLLGNVKQIKTAIQGWNKQLADFASHRLQNEELAGNTVADFSETGHSLEKVEKGLEKCQLLFTAKAAPNATALLSALLLYVALLFPYILQDRHTKSRQRLLGRSKGKASGDDTDSFNIDDGQDQTTSASTPADDYESFTL